MSAPTPSLGRLRPLEPGRPAYQQIEEQLLASMARGELEPGARLPPERELATALGVSRMTLRQALDGLEQRGLLVRAGGRGTYVAEPKVQQDLRAMRTYPGRAARAGRRVLDRAARVRHGAPPLVAARALGLADGAPAHRILRLRRAGGVPLLLETAWVDAIAHPDLLEHDFQGSLWDVMASLGRAGDARGRAARAGARDRRAGDGARRRAGGAAHARGAHDLRPGRPPAGVRRRLLPRRSHKLRGRGPGDQLARPLRPAGERPRGRKRLGGDLRAHPVAEDVDLEPRADVRCLRRQVARAMLRPTA